MLKKSMQRFRREHSKFEACNESVFDPSLVKIAIVSVWIAAQVHVHQQATPTCVVIGKSTNSVKWKAHLVSVGASQSCHDNMQGRS